MLDYLRESADERAIRREHTKREKERRKRRIHKYGQMELKHSRRGCISCMLAVLSVGEHSKETYRLWKEAVMNMYWILRL